MEQVLYFPTNEDILELIAGGVTHELLKSGEFVFFTTNWRGQQIRFALIPEIVDEELTVQVLCSDTKGGITDMLKR